jgi:hypothetical protein
VAWIEIAGFQSVSEWLFNRSFFKIPLTFTPHLWNYLRQVTVKEQSYPLPDVR